MATFLVRALDLPVAVTDHFVDDENNLHEDAINRVADAEITLGCGDDRYCPTAVVTREQMASFLARARQLPATGVDAFTDDELSQHEPDINRIAEAAITLGCGGSRYCPKAVVTREQMAAFLHRAFPS